MKIIIFLKKISKIKKMFMNKTHSYFQFYICCANFYRIGQQIKDHSPLPQKGSIYLK